MKKIIRKIKERVMRVAFKVACGTEDRLDYMRADLVSNYDWDNFFVRVAFWVVFGLEWLVIRVKLWLDGIDFKRRLKEHKGVKWDKKLKEYVKI